MTVAPREIIEAPAREWDRYPEYKDSGAQWVGDVPGQWYVSPIKWVVRAKITDGPHETPTFLEEGVPFLSVDSIQGGRLVFEGCRYVSPEAHRQYSQKCKPTQGDLLLGKAASIGKVALVEETFEFSVWSPLALIQPDEHKLESRYLYYSISGVTVQDQIELLSNKNTQKNIGMGDIENLVVPVPSLPEQRAIADFLDRETQKIDNLIAKRERLIELLEEKRTALVSRAVTKGLDPEMPMKDSGVRWLGEIPRHWNAIRLRNIAESMQTGPFGSQLHSHDYVTGGIPVINPSHLRDGRLDPDPTCAVDEQTRSRLQRHELREGDIVFARRGELGRCALVTTQEIGWLCGTGSLRVRLLRHLAEPTFLNLSLSTSGVKDWLVLESVGTTMDNLNTSILARVPLPLPPLVEQDEIVAFINRETSRIDALIGKVQYHIEKLREYRTALISAAVTGKIDVRKEASAPVDREPDKMVR